MLILYSRSAFCISLICSLGEAIDVATTIPRKVQEVLKKNNISGVKDILNNSRRIIIGTETLNNRPYMVYLKLPSNNAKYKDYRRWLCGGVIIHEEYVLTSAACIEDAKHFYIVSGTYRHDEADDRFTNRCIKNGAKKAIWKCIPRNYEFDGHENDNIRWMNNDIAIVKVEDEFDFTRRVRGCDFIPKPICYNNQTSKYEESENAASIAGWGSTERYNDGNPDGAKQNLLEAPVQIMSKQRCKQRWGRRYYNIIDNYMICTKDVVPDLTEVCAEKYVDCTDMQYSGSEEDRRRVLNPSQLVLHSAYHNGSTRRQANIGSGGFCENDHGGPLVYGSGPSSVVIGIISACLVKENTNKCYGPFLYTSVYKNRVLINCAIFKEARSSCDKMFRSSITHMETEINWADHPDGPAKNEVVDQKESSQQMPTQRPETPQKASRPQHQEQQQQSHHSQRPELSYQPKHPHQTYQPQQPRQQQLQQPQKPQPRRTEPVQEQEFKRRQFGVNQTVSLNITHYKYKFDDIYQHSGIVIRSFDNTTKTTKPDNLNNTAH